MKKHFVEIFSPGSFVAETSLKEIDSWDTQEAMKMAHSIVERHNSRPYGFRFVTRGRGANDLDSKVVDTSPMYFLGGTVLTLADIKAENNPDNRILITNMEVNKWPRVIRNLNSWSATLPLQDDDVVLDFKYKA